MTYQSFLMSGSELQNFLKLVALHKSQITLRHRKFFFLKQKFCLIQSMFNNQLLAQLIETCWELKCTNSMQMIWGHTDNSMKIMMIDGFIKHDKARIAKILLGKEFSTANFSSTTYLLDRIEAKDIDASLIAIQFGCIDDIKRNIQTLANFIARSDPNYEPKMMYFKKDDDSCYESPTFEQLSCLVENLSFKCKKKPTKKVVKFLTVLIKAGADVECLNRQAGGNRTSPLIVATELALITGNGAITHIL